jgi:phenylpropionate dioxygenase-like ring-hydroxylating dioxygenase large terminal subunit
MRPRGWFMIGWSSQLGPGGVLPLKAFGQDLVAFRTEDGKAQVLDAFCQHIGAHLGWGGTVSGDCIVCPFHGWHWSADGTNRLIPESSSTNRSRKIRPWHTCERNGIIYIWHNADGGDPDWEMPDLFETLDDGDPTGPFHNPTAFGQYAYPALMIQPRVTMENIVDPGHFRYVHHMRSTPTVVGHDITDHTFRTHVAAPSRSDRDGRRIDKADLVTLMYFGVGVAYSRFAGRDNTHIVVGCTPIDAEHSNVYQTIWIEEVPGESATQTQARMDQVSSVVPEDLVIWSHQAFLDTPGFTADEARLWHAARKWCRSFEPSH